MTSITIEGVKLVINNNKTTLHLDGGMTGVMLSNWLIKNNDEIQTFKEIHIEDYIRPIALHKDDILNNEDSTAKKQQTGRVNYKLHENFKIKV